MACYSWTPYVPLDKIEENAKPEEPGPDPFFEGSTLIMGLNKHTFEPFLAKKDITLVMFYHPMNKTAQFSREHFKKAAAGTIRDNHAYASVNCGNDPEVCCRSNIYLIPYFQLFAQGRPVGFNDNPRLFDHKEMQHWVENTRVLTQMKTKVK